ncbi:MAG: NAD-dependent epimerase/dehydratase family protein, partial [Planctomycetes bacterium]|nr:NAD-dependent epimerase/dehydratase family protein [Planctomycetota bacterium]
MATRKASLLITGGAGFIGSTLVRQCLAEDDSLVVNLD